MGTPRAGHGDRLPLDCNSALASDEVTIDLRCIAVLKTAKFLPEHAVERVSHHRRYYVEVGLGEDRR